MALDTSCTRVETTAGTAPPAAICIAPSTVEFTRTAGTAAEAASGATSEPDTAAESAKPRRVSRAAQAIPPPPQPAPDGPDRPTQPPRCLTLGEALQVAQHDRRPALLREPSDFLVERLSEVVPIARRPPIASPSRPPCRSCDRRRDAAERPHEATRRATPCSQLAAEPRLRIERPRPARTRNVAWKASSASCVSRRICGRRAAPSGHDGPPAPRRPSRPPPGRPTNRASNCSSVNPPVVPTWKSARGCPGSPRPADDPPCTAPSLDPRSLQSSVTRAPVLSGIRAKKTCRQRDRSGQSARCPHPFSGR